MFPADKSADSSPASHDQPDVNDIRNQTERELRYGDYVRKQWLAQEKQANAESARITRMVRKPG